MSVTKKIYTIGSVQQLIDLNGDTTNFEISFKVVSENSETFEVLVVDQKTLDKSENIQYRTVKGDISGNIIHDKNIYDNYYIILKSDKPCNVEVEITKTEIPFKQVVHPTNNHRKMDVQQKIVEKYSNQHSNSNNIQYFTFFLIALIIVCSVTYLCYNKSILKECVSSCNSSLDNTSELVKKLLSVKVS